MRELQNYVHQYSRQSRPRKLKYMFSTGLSILLQYA